MKGWLVTNHFMTGGAFDKIADMFTDAAASQGIALLRLTNAELTALLPDGALLRGHDRPDFVLFWDKDTRLAYLLERMGLRVYNSAAAIAACDDKTWTHALLRGLPMPRTILCPQTYPGVGYPDASFVDEAADALGLPLVIKEGCGSFGQQVYLAHTIDEAKDIIAKRAGTPMLMQAFVAHSAGRDARLYVVGTRVIAAIRRENLAGDFRANIAHGGTASAYTPTQDERALAIRACKALGLTFAGVDILWSERRPLLCEVNSNAHFAALLQTTGVNPAREILRHIGGIQ